MASRIRSLARLPRRVLGRVARKVLRVEVHGPPRGAEPAPMSTPPAAPPPPRPLRSPDPAAERPAEKPAPAPVLEPREPDWLVEVREGEGPRSRVFVVKPASGEAEGAVLEAEGAPPLAPALLGLPGVTGAEVEGDRAVVDADGEADWAALVPAVRGVIAAWLTNRNRSG